MRQPPTSVAPNDLRSVILTVTPLPRPVANRALTYASRFQDLWILSPRVIHNLLGPKLADLRLYTYQVGRDT